MSDSGSDSGSDSASDSSTHWPPKCYAYMNIRKSHPQSEEGNIKQLIEEGKPIPPSLLWAAVYWRRPESVDLLLSAGVDPNRRHVKAEEIMPRGEHDWLDRDPDRMARWEDIGTHYPLHVGAFYQSVEDRQKSYHIVRSLLRHGADPYAVFASELEDMDDVDEARPLFPGQEICHSQDPTTASDWQTQRIFSLLGEDFEGTIPPFVWLEFGLRSVIHSILEEGIWFEFFLASPEFMKILKLEHRDPQGRTLFLSACRNAFGADIQLRKEWHGGVELQQGQDSNSDILPTPCVEGAQNQTAMQVLLDLGADPLVTDNQGKNALHQLLDTHSGDYSSPSKIRQSLRHLAARFPSLVNQPDRNGMSPIHTAMRRLWRYTEFLDKWGFSDPHRREDSEKRPPEDCVLDLIEAGADVHARDAKNNTVLHYLADAHLDALDHGERRRQLFSLLLDEFDCALDINTANACGLRPIQVMLGYSARKDDWQDRDERFARGMPPDTASVDVELFGKFDEAGTDWKVRDGRGRTLLHGVVQTKGWSARAEWRCRYLIKKGVDPLARDDDGKTALDVAAEDNRYWVIQLLKEYEEAEAHNKPSNIVNSEPQT